MKMGKLPQTSLQIYQKPENFIIKAIFILVVMLLKENSFLTVI